MIFKVSKQTLDDKSDGCVTVLFSQPCIKRYVSKS